MYQFTIATITNYHKLSSGLLQLIYYLTVLEIGSLKMGLTGLKSMCWPGCVPSGGENTFLAFS